MVMRVCMRVCIKNRISAMGKHQGIVHRKRILSISVYMHEDLMPYLAIL